MYEKTLLEISRKLGGRKKKFYRLTRKNRREVYFQNKKEAIKFIKRKLDSGVKNPKARQLRIPKKIAYILIKLQILQPFLKKIYLSEKFGEVIYIGGQIKSFNLKDKSVMSFTKNNNDKEGFIKSKEFQKKIAKKNFAPKIFEINKRIPSSKEELLLEYRDDEDIKVFKKLFSFYKLNGIKEVSLKKYINFLDKKLKESGIKDPYIKTYIKNTINKISSIYPPNLKLKITTVHGDFAKEQVLLKNNSYVFVDWNSEEDIIARDLIKFIRREDLLKDKKFNELLKIYPKDVRENIGSYIILHDIYFMIEKRKRIQEFRKKRIENVWANLEKEGKIKMNGKIKSEN